MSLLLAIIIILIILFLLLRDIISPAVILCITWAFPVLMGIIKLGIGTDLFDDSFYGFYVFGLLVFVMGYFVAQRSTPRGPKGLEIRNKKPVISEKVIVALLIIQGVIAIYGLIKARTYIMNNLTYNFWFTYKRGTSSGELDLGILYTINKSFAKSFSVYLFIEALCEKNKRLWVLTGIQLLLTTVIFVFSSGRSVMFAVLVPLIFAYLIIRRKNTGHVLGIGGLAIALLLSIFMIINSLKYAYSSPNTLIDSVSAYVTEPMVAFKDYIGNNRYLEYGNGKYFFRFFLALLKVLGFNTEVVPLLEPMISTEFGHGNVYTFYKWYTNDFGLWFALIIQFLCGVLHGTLYKKMYYNKTADMVFWNSMLFYPLVMQFFQDQYISLTSTWVQVFIFYLVLYKPIRIVAGSETVFGSRNVNNIKE